MRKDLEESPLIVDYTDPKFKELAKQDLIYTISRNNLAIEKNLLESLLVQSVVGHAQNGHSGFYGNSFPNATISDIIKAADLDLQKIKGQRQGLIDDYREWLELVKEDKVNHMTFKGHPLLGFLPFNNPEYTIDPESVIKGTILCGLMDSNEWRMKTLDEFDQITIEGGLLTIGGGESYLFNLEKLSELGVGIEDLSSVEVTDKTLEQFRKNGAITTSDDPLAEVGYVRRRIGNGTSDDCAFILTGYMCGKSKVIESRSALFAGFCIDAVDTYDKLVAEPVEGGYDEYIAKELRKEFPDMISDKDITNLIYYVSKDNGGKLVSSSHKRLVQNITYLSPIKSTVEYHLDFLLTGNRQKDFRVGFDQMSSKRFYNVVKKRLEHFIANT